MIGLALLVCGASIASGFRAITPSSSRRRPTRLRDIHGWRDDDIAREICLLPFPLEESLLQGETKQLRLYEDRFIALFDECMENHHGILGMGLFASSTGVLMHLPLCQIEAYNRSFKEMGIFVTIRAVSRAELESVTQEGPYIKAKCKEFFDDDSKPNLSRANVIADDIERTIVELSSLDSQLKGYDQQYEAMMGEDRSFDIDSEDEESDVEEDRQARFRQAYQTALDSDANGYTSSVVDEDVRSLRELTAISWAANFCVNPTKIEIPLLRLQLLESTCVERRLRLVQRALKIEHSSLKHRLNDAKRAIVDDEEDDDSV